MKKFSLILTIACLLSGSLSIAQLTIPPPSPYQKIEQQFATSMIKIEYSRPGVKGRKIFGDLVPFDQVWRTGANGATTIYFGEEVMINDVTVAKGKYGLVTIPGKKEWTVIISKDTNITSPSDYNKDNDIVRISSKPISLSLDIETFTIELENVKPEECEILMMWEKTLVKFSVKADIDKKIMAQIDEAMKGEKKPYYQAARYYYDNDKDLNKALEWSKAASKENENAFWIFHLTAKIEMKLKKYEDVVTSATKSKELAEKAGNNDYVKLNEKLIEEAKKLK